jgi:hypothetical protein
VSGAPAFSRPGFAQHAGPLSQGVFPKVYDKFVIQLREHYPDRERVAVDPRGWRGRSRLWKDLAATVTPVSGGVDNPAGTAKSSPRAATLPAVEGVEDIHEALVREVERELAEFDAIDARVEQGLSQRPRRRIGNSVVYSFRLDPGELMALERRAALLGLKPSVLARNLVREGLRGPVRQDWPDDGVGREWRDGVGQEWRDGVSETEAYETERCETEAHERDAYGSVGSVEW